MGEIASGVKEKLKRLESLITAREYQQAIDLLLDVIDYFDEVGDFKNRDENLIKVNKCYFSLAEQSKAQEDYFDAAEIFYSAAFLQKQHEKTELSYQLFNAAIDCFVLAGQLALSKMAYLEVSMLYSTAAKYAQTELNNKQQAFNYYQHAINALQKELELNTNNADFTNLCRTLLELGKIYEYLEQEETALLHYKKAVVYSIDHELFSFTAESFQYMATCYERLGNMNAMVDCLNKAVSYRLQEAEKFSKKDLPLEAVQNFIVAANCITKMKKSDELLKKIIQNEANCFLTVAKWNVENGNILQAAYYERNAAYCYNQLGESETSINLLLTAAEKLLSINELSGAADNFQDLSLCQEKIGNYLKAANYALEAADLARESEDLELAIQNYERASEIYQKVGSLEQNQFCNARLAECYTNLAELNLGSDKFHIAAFLYYKAAILYSKANEYKNAAFCYNHSIEYYEKAITLAIQDNELLLASYSACCATLVCLIMKQPSRAETILNVLRDNTSNSYYQLSDSVIKAFKTRNPNDYDSIHQKFSKIIQNSSEIKNLLYSSKNYL
ncbi:MAG TPA: hypothetical protein VMV49_02350 [Candidatus Deferrimicrobium sp.]|nr:hypothetical protein [Candidatus Deferrimicrobium sp.]